MKKRLIVWFLCGIIVIGFAAKMLWFFLEVQRKQDLTNLGHNFLLVYTRLDDYKKLNGSYPPQQDMKSLLKTLRLPDGDLFKTSIDIGTAEYHAPTHKSESPILKILIKPHFLSNKKQQQVIFTKKHDGYRGEIKDAGTR